MMEPAPQADPLPDMGLRYNRSKIFQNNKPWRSQAFKKSMASQKKYPRPLNIMN
jgi:hypothetical protein